MKRAFICFLPFILMLAGGCLKKSDNANFVVPLGNFNGIFTRIHYNATKKTSDTIKAGLSLVIDINTGYAISGDTTYHAGSYGDFAAAATVITFYDHTLNYSLNKTHLEGDYTYTYDGSTLQMQQTKADTLKYLYVFKQY
jgi:hypothetical protein